MTDYFKLGLAESDVLKISNLGLAHLGDAVYELMVRSWLCLSGGVTSKGLHFAAVRYVAAPAQAVAAKKLLPLLTEEETAVFRRGKNTKVNSVPSHASLDDYHCATGLEALFGYIYLHGDTGRLNELFSIIMEDEHAS